MKMIEALFRPYNGGKLNLSGLTDELLVIYFNYLLKLKKQDLLIVIDNLYEANEIYQRLLKYNNQALLFPMDDFLTSEAAAISPDLKIKRLETLNQLADCDQPNIVITNLMGYLRYLPLKALWQKRIVHLSLKMTINKQSLIYQLLNMGYQKEIIVTKTGELGSRGFVVDVFPIGELNPIRIEFWGDEIESLKYFDLETQRSLKKIKKIAIYPFDEFVIENEEENVVRKQKNLPLYSKEITNIKGFLNNPIVIHINYHLLIKAYQDLRSEIKDYHNHRDKEQQTDYMHYLEDINNNDEIFAAFEKSGFNRDVLNQHYEAQSIHPYYGKIDLLNKDLASYLKFSKTVIIALENQHQLNNFISFLKVPYFITGEKNLKPGVLNLIIKDINNGYMINSVIVLSASDIFSQVLKKKKFKSSFRYGIKIKDVYKLKEGDYVVHRIHGVGLYGGIKTLTKKDIKKDYLLVNYQGNDKLYIPVEKIDLISKYSSGEGVVPSIHKLGGVIWQKTKLRAKNKIKDMAFKLLATTASRKINRGYRYAKDSEEQLLFEQEFNYQPTKDQLISIDQIKQDMEAPEPMDRLLCGDVGYGKTEVAFRAAFKAVSNNKQVCYLCPTTILSHQHYINALERFRNYPFNIALLNRFTSPKKAKETIEGLKKGLVDIIIGTHRLLSRDIYFKNLGLLIIDEEQRFGVNHKERIKQYKNNIDVLTLSATPIPRTLQLSMAGLRDLSLIETPPMNRFPIQTYVLEEDNYIIRDAVYKELARQGQVFFLYNSIVSIEKKVEELKKLIPQARITYAHGKMNKWEIENRMVSFINREYDLLVCTTIIETGIDIANVNTLIVLNADRFGLSQLYQIRGRVGRTNKIAYAYLMYKREKILTEEANKRLAVIKEFTELGSGFSIAMRDLSIRGAGNLLGEEQAGYIDSVGIDLYLKMLGEEIDRLKGVHIKEENYLDDKPLLEVATYIDDQYVSDDDLKIEIHKKINEIDSYQKLISIKEELEDRFGKVSETMLLYMYQEWFEKIAQRIGVKEVKQNKHYLELIFSSSASRCIKINKIIKGLDNFVFSYLNNRFKIKFKISNLKKHWIYDLVLLLESIEEQMI